MVTLIITANRENHLTEALMSIALQTDKDFDLILCADTNNDDFAYYLMSEMSQFITANTKKIIKVKGNGTAGYIRNKSFSHATTKWIAYLDGDDMLHPDAIKHSKQVISKLDDSFSIISTGMFRAYADGRIKKIETSLNYYPPTWIYFKDPDLHNHPTYFNQFQIVQRSAWQEYHYNETTNGEDIDYMLHHLLIGKYYKIEEYLYYFREATNSFSGKHFKNGDICSQRYRSGYYEKLFNKHYSSFFKDNFS